MFKLHTSWINKTISSYIYIDENNAPLIEIEAGIMHEIFSKQSGGDLQVKNLGLPLTRLPILEVAYFSWKSHQKCGQFWYFITELDVNQYPVYQRGWPLFNVLKPHLLTLGYICVLLLFKTSFPCNRLAL